MWYAPKVTVAPENEPVSVDDVKAQTNIDADDDNNLLQRMIATARGHVERYCGIRIVSQTLELRCDNFADLERLPVGPVQSISSIVYTDLDGVDQTLPDTVYELRSVDELETMTALKYGQSWPNRRPFSMIAVTVIAGFEDIPPPIIAAILLHVATSYQQRENEAAESWTALDALLCNFRRGV